VGRPNKRGKSASNDREANRAYHDRVAGRYDQIYQGPRWDVWYELSYAGVKPYLPVNLRDPVLDLGCGTGYFGLKMARSGYDTTFSDLSIGMLEAARRKVEEQGLTERAQFLQADIMDLSALPENHFALAVAQGDVLSFATHPPHALKEIRRVLQPGGVLVASVDQTYAALEHYAEKGDLDGLDDLIRTQEMQWLARDQRERFTVRTFTPNAIRDFLEKAGFELLDLFGKTVLNLKTLEPVLDDPASRRKVIALEKKLHRRSDALGLASHLQFAARLRP
jgi:ubiquinone/menaquinone biosynthesis C-methylase UbiE